MNPELWRRAEEVFHAAVDLAPEARSAFLDQACGKDVILRQQVEQAIARGQVRRDFDAEQFVWEMCGIYLAHHVAYRFVKSRDAGQRAEIAFKALLARAQPEEKLRKSKSPSG